MQNIFESINLAFIVNFDLFHPSQWGFMEPRSLSDNIWCFVWLSQDKDVPVAALSLDAEMFDKVELHSLLSVFFSFASIHISQSG